MQGKYDFSPIIGDIEEEYMMYRKNGKSREEALAAIQEASAEALNDPEDCLAISLGLAFALCKKKELTTAAYTKAVNAIENFKQLLKPDDNRHIFLNSVERYLNDQTLYGPEAVYHRRNSYIPNWQLGDLFAHVLTHPSSKNLGIENWIVLFYKVGEYAEGYNTVQIMYVILCPQEKLPSSSQELQDLKFLPMMNHGDRRDYLVQMSVKSAKDEQSYQLKYIGNFPDVLPPADRTEEDPKTAMPLFGMVRKDDVRPGFEDQICRILKRQKTGDGSLS